MREVLLKIKKSDPSSPILENISKLECCEFADSISSEKIDGIVKIVTRERLYKLLKNLYSNIEEIVKIDEIYKYKKSRGKKIGFWLEFKAKQEFLSRLKEYVKKEKNISEVYRSKGKIYIRGEADSIEDVTKIWTELYDGGIVSKGSRTKTYFILNTFRGQ